ncbi:hypothetical protein [Methylobacter sp.]|jgi:hypothetical protein|uniref:hypothetical protein n=1 Tax=Methylobacter sp. TaxID=2051955 RepID=UPI003DA47667
MSDMREINSEIVDDQRGCSVILQTIPSHQGLIKTNKLLLTVVFFLMTVVLILGFLLFPTHDVVPNYRKATPSEIYAAEMNSVLSAEVNTLKGQLIGLISGSIESKLRTLEESIRLGAVSSSLGTIEDLKNDVKVLRSYSDPAQKEQVAVDSEQIMLEMSQLKNLIYLTLASCGLMLAALAGIWIKNRNRLPYKEIKRSYLGRN